MKFSKCLKLSFLFLTAAVLAPALQSCARRAPRELAKTVQVQLVSGDTLAGSLSDTGLSVKSQGEIANAIQKVFNPKNCKACDNYDVAMTTSGGWVNFRYNTLGLDYYTVAKSTDGKANAQKLTIAAKKEITGETGTIQTSLWESMTAKNIPGDVIVNFTDIFAWDIDFLTEPRAGDTFKVIRERFVADNGKILSGRILAARYTASGQIYEAVLFTGPDGKSDYFTPKGEALRRAFLKAPLSYRRISSHFTLKRWHPILKYFRPHLGIDYAAPSGTPIDSIGEGTVMFAGRKDGFGNQVGIRHPNGYASYYGHMKGFGKGIRAGKHVTQGQLIGYVGMTGLATGPHLDFRISQNGKFVNFERLKFPHAQNIPSKNTRQFHDATKGLLTQLAEMR
jgi:murein DD-endopeptidase MepM/ murein hydrolase activator NlpD